MRPQTPCNAGGAAEFHPGDVFFRMLGKPGACRDPAADLAAMGLLSEMAECGAFFPYRIIIGGVPAHAVRQLNIYIISHAGLLGK